MMSSNSRSRPDLNSKILFIDIETSPCIGYTWGKWEQNVIEFIQQRFILCCGYKWGGGKIRVLAISKGACRDRDDSTLVKRISRLLDRAEVVVAQNGDAFDVKIINTRLVIHRIPPPSPYRTIDTLKVARSRFAFMSNKLDDLGKDLSEGEKVKHRGFSMWTDFLAGKDKARKQMVKYNRGDIVLLERIYKRFRPWIKTHPNITRDDKEVRCPKCNSTNLQSRGTARTQTMLYRRFQCKNCGGWCRGNRGEKFTRVNNA